MIADLRALAVFAKTVETGSFRAAAAALQLSPSVVSHHIAQLEARLGVALLYRSTRRLSLTQDGAALFQHASRMLDAAQCGLNAVAQRTAMPSGHLTVTLPVFLTRGTVMDALAAFAQAYPNVGLTLDFSDEKQDLIRDGIDLAIRIGGLSDSALKSRKLFVLERCLVAAPSLVAVYAPPTTPQDLQDWPWIGLRMRPHHKILHGPDGAIWQWTFKPRLVVNSVDAMCQLALAGAGLATPARFMVRQELAAGSLVQPLPAWQVPALGVYAVWPPNAPRDGLTMHLVRDLATRLGDESGSTTARSP